MGHQLLQRRSGFVAGLASAVFLATTVAPGSLRSSSSAIPSAPVAATSAAPGFYVWYYPNEYTCCRGPDGVTPHPVHYSEVPATTPANLGVPVILSGPYTKQSDLGTALCSNTINQAQAWIRNWAIVGGTLLSNLPCIATGKPDLRLLTGVLTSNAVLPTASGAPGPPAPSRRARTTLVGLARPTARHGIPGVSAERTTPESVTPPEGFRVEVTVRRGDRAPCHPADQFRFGLGGRPVVAERIEPTATGACRYGVMLPEGKHRVSMTMAANDGTIGSGVLQAVVQDWLVFGLGDSNGAGEGAPSEGPDLWTSPRCHRSVNSFQSMVVKALEERDELTSVTFAHLACSGAAVDEGILGTYVGLIPPDPPSDPLPAQIDEMKRLANGREIDAVLISIGINDIGFGPLVGFCIDNDDCPRATGFEKSPDKTRTLEAFVDSFFVTDLKAKQDTLAKRFELMAGAFRRAGVKDNRVVITEYFDPTRDQNGVICNPLVSVPGKGVFDLAEASWAYNSVLAPLNRSIRTAAQKHGWRVVKGIAEEFSTHGCCAGSAAWIRSLTGAFALQGDRFGTLHATPEGNRATAAKVNSVLTSSLYPSGKPRAPLK